MREEELSLEQEYKVNIMIAKRQDRQREEIIEYGRGKTEKDFLAQFYEDEIKKTENSLKDSYVTLRRQLQINKSLPKLNTSDILIEYNQFSESIFLKYAYIAIRKMVEVLKRGNLMKINLLEEKENMPWTMNLNHLDYIHFKNFTQSDMAMEIIRFIKGMTIVEEAYDDYSVKKL